MTSNENFLRTYCETFRAQAKLLQEVVNGLRRIRETYGVEGNLGLSNDDLSALDFDLASFRRADCDPHYRIAVAGGFNTGKSEVINAMLGREVVPSKADHTTFVPTVIRASSGADRTNTLRYLTEKEVQEILAGYAEKCPDANWPTTTQQAAALTKEMVESLVAAMRLDARESPDLMGLLNALRDSDFRRRILDTDQPGERAVNEAEVGQLVIRGSKLLEKYLAASVSIDLPAFELGHDVELVDLPGNNAADVWARGITERYVKDADAMILVLTLENAITDSVVALLQSVRSWGGNHAERLFVVINKTDVLANYRAHPTAVADFFKSVDEGLARWLPGARPRIVCVSAAAALETSVAHKDALARLGEVGESGMPEFDDRLKHARLNGGIGELRRQLLTFLQSDARQFKLRSIQNRWTGLLERVRGRTGPRIDDAVRMSGGNGDNLRQQIMLALQAMDANTALVLEKLKSEIPGIVAYLSETKYEELLAQSAKLQAAATANRDDREDDANLSANTRWEIIYQGFRGNVMAWLRSEVMGRFLEEESRSFARFKELLHKFDLELRALKLAPLPERPGERLMESLDLRISEVLPPRTPSRCWNKPGEGELFGNFQKQFSGSVNRWCEERLISVFEVLRRVLALSIQWHLDHFYARLKQVMESVAASGTLSQQPERLGFLVTEDTSADERKRLAEICKLAELLKKTSPVPVAVQ